MEGLTCPQVVAREGRREDAPLLEEVFPGNFDVLVAQSAHERRGPFTKMVDEARSDAAELAAWTTVASMILNLDETVTKS